MTSNFLQEINFFVLSSVLNSSFYFPCLNYICRFIYYIGDRQQPDGQKRLNTSFENKITQYFLPKFPCHT